MKCDAQQLDGADGGFTCSVLGDKVGVNKFLHEENLPECDACIFPKKGLFGKKNVF